MKQSNEELEKEFLECFETRSGKVRLNKKMDRNVFAIGVLMTGASLVGVARDMSPLSNFIFGLGAAGGLAATLHELKQGFPLQKDEEIKGSIKQ